MSFHVRKLRNCIGTTLLRVMHLRRISMIFLIGCDQPHCLFWHMSLVFERVLSFVEGYN